jgi:hypothetical protein
MLDRAVYGREPVRAIEDMSIEELEGRFRVMSERAFLARWGGRAAGFVGGLLGGAKLGVVLL